MGSDLLKWAEHPLQEIAASCLLISAPIENRGSPPSSREILAELGYSEDQQEIFLKEETVEQMSIHL